MRAGTDSPRRSRRYPGGLIGILVTLGVLILGLLALRGVAVEATNYLWFGSVGLANVWSKMAWTRIDLALAFSAMFLVACWVSLAVAGRLPPLPAPEIVVDPELGPVEPTEDVAARYRGSAAGRHPVGVRAITSVVLALLVGSGASEEWNNWILFTHAVSFGANDPVFHMDIGFFVFKLPFLSFLVGWAFVAALVLLVASATALYLNGSIRLQGEGPRVTREAKAQLSALLGLIALIKAGGYFFSRFGLDMSTRGYAEGAFFTDLHASLPALNLLVLVSLVCMVIFLVNIGRPGWMLPVIGVGLWAVVAVAAGAIYPAIVQTFDVSPNQLNKEAPYIRRNLAATKEAMGIANVVSRPFADNSTLTAQSASVEASSLDDVSVWDPTLALASFNQLDDLAPYYSFDSAGVDRYNLSGTLTPTILAVRNLAGSGHDTWVNQHLAYIHGEGAVLAAANATASGGNPDLVISGLPPTSAAGAPVITQPEVYFGEGMSGYVIANTDQAVIDSKGSAYTGAGGVAAGGLFRRAAFALRFGSLDMLTSNLVNPSSKVMFVRNVEARVKKAAPFLAYDANPYAVLVNGQIDYVIDAYTTTDSYPYAQQASVSSLSSAGSGGSVSGLHSNFNYVRNSVTVVVNAYSGSMTFYVVDPADPIVTAYEHAYPSLFTPGTSMPDALKAQLRYPADLFTVQAAMLGRYHVSTAASFYAGADVWTSSEAAGTGALTYSASTGRVGAAAGGVATAGGATAGATAGEVTATPPHLTTTTPRGAATTTTIGAIAGASQAASMMPTYQVSELPGDPSLSFNIMTPLVTDPPGGGSGSLTGLLVARSTPGEYGGGELQIYSTPTGRFLAGPAQVSAQIHQDQAISTKVSELNNQGDTVLLGTVQAVPVGQSLLWVRPLYVSSGSALAPRLSEVIVVYGKQSAMEPTFAKALADLVGEAVPGLGSTSPLSGVPPVLSTVAPSVKALIADADAELGTAQGELRQGDLSAYQADVEQAQLLLGQAERDVSPLPTAPAPAPSASRGPKSEAGSTSATTTTSIAST